VTPATQPRMATVIVYREAATYGFVSTERGAGLTMRVCWVNAPPASGDTDGSSVGPHAE
jgi:hypothetical protein